MSEIFSGLKFGGVRRDPNAGIRALFEGHGRKRAASAAAAKPSSSSATALDFFGTMKKTPVATVSEDVVAAAPSCISSSSAEAAQPSGRKRKRKRKRGKMAVDAPHAAAESVDVFGRTRAPTAAATSAPSNSLPDAAESAHAAEQMRSFRTRMRIKVEGGDVPSPCVTFEALMRVGADYDELDAEARLRSRQFLLRNVEASRYKEPTAVQMQASPAMLMRRDVLAVAPTGSGKTAAFLLPTLALLVQTSVSKRAAGAGPRSLLLAPTTELAAQLFREAERLRLGGGRHVRRCVLLNRARAASLLSAAAASEKQAAYDVDIAVSTPMRVVHLIRGGRQDDGSHVVKLSLARLEVLVLDEADKLFDLDFVEQIDEILTACGGGGGAGQEEGGARRPRLVRALFSATLPQHVEQLARTVLQRPIRVVVGARGGSNRDIEQHLLFVGREQGKVMAVRQLLNSGRAAGGSSEVLGRDGDDDAASSSTASSSSTAASAAASSGAGACPPVRPPVLIFVQSKDRADELFDEIVYDGFNVACIHSGIAKKSREKILREFRLGRVWVVIATELMGRGLDFKGISCVINYDLPLSTVSCLLCTVTFHTNYAHNLTRSP